jgi:hypothetical protein
MAKPAFNPITGNFTVGAISGTLAVVADTVVVSDVQVNPPANAAAQGPFPIALADEIVITGVQAEHIIDFLGTI